MDGADRETFVFCDLAGFTALTEDRGDDYAADIATSFCAELNELLPETAEDFKMLGDACLVHAADPAGAIGFGLDLAAAFDGRDGRLGVRVGMHTGSAVRRGGDWYGRAVNVAARVVELARPAEVIVTGATVAAAGNLPGVALDPLGARALRNVRDPVDVYRARSADPGTP